MPTLRWYTPATATRHIALTTYRKSGVPVTTQVWFARDGERLYLYTFANSGKAKRLRHTSQVTIAPCTANGKVTGLTIPATARFVTAPQEVSRARFVMWRRYNGVMLFIRLLNGMQQMRSTNAPRIVFLALEARLPEESRE